MAHFAKIKEHIIAIKNRYIKYNKTVPTAITTASNIEIKDKILRVHANTLIDAANTDPSTNIAQVAVDEKVLASKLNEVATGIKNIQNTNLKK